MSPDIFIFLGIFVTSVGYYFILQWWSREYPENFDENTWLTVVVGCGYVLLWLLDTIPFNYWIKITCGFFVACPPIIYRSLQNNAKRHRELTQYLENNRMTDDTQ